MDHMIYIWLSYSVAAAALAGLTFFSVAEMKQLEKKKAQ
jgi:heme exporter protein D